MLTLFLYFINRSKEIDESTLQWLVIVSAKSLLQVCWTLKKFSAERKLSNKTALCIIRSYKKTVLFLLELPTGSLTTSLLEGSSCSWGFLGAAEGEPQPLRQLWRRPINYANPRWQGHRSWILFSWFPLFFLIVNISSRTFFFLLFRCVQSVRHALCFIWIIFNSAQSIAFHIRYCLKCSVVFKNILWI